MKIIKPTLFVDEQKCKSNIQAMAEKAKRNNLIFRPHFKTHQSIEIGNWFKSYGVDKITVSSLDMALYFSDDWKDITVAFPVNILEIDLINLLASKVKLNILVESKEIIERLNQELTSPIYYFIKIDIGYHRSGIAPDNINLIDLILSHSNSEKLIFNGFLGHAGHSYKARTKEAIANIHRHSIELLQPLKQKYITNYPNLLLSVGDTPTCSVMEDFSMVDEMRPGNFIFYDLTQAQIGSNLESQIAVVMACPIVALHPERNELVVYGGGVHFAKDRLEGTPRGTIFGKLVEITEDGIGQVDQEVYINSLSQEHGIVLIDKEKIKKYQLGDILYFLPVHSCMTAHAMKQYTSFQGNTITRLI